MKIKVTIDVQPFNVPHSVTINNGNGSRQSGMQPNRQMLLYEMDQDVIEMMCDEFRKNIMEVRQQQIEDRGTPSAEIQSR